jgi:hypothetical protein
MNGACSAIILSTAPEASLLVDERNVLVVNECQVAQEVIEEACPVIREPSMPDQGAEKIETLIMEVENLKVVLIKPIHFKCSSILLFYFSLLSFPARKGSINLHIFGS